MLIPVVITPSIARHRPGTVSSPARWSRWRTVIMSPPEWAPQVPGDGHLPRPAEEHRPDLGRPQPPRLVPPPAGVDGPADEAGDLLRLHGRQPPEVLGRGAHPGP